MKLEEFLENIQKLVLENPDVLNYEVVYAKDDEGNGFDEVHFAPTLGIFEDREFISKSDLKDYEREESEINSICIN